jgi:TP901 family phage tail tape measure protein
MSRVGIEFFGVDAGASAETKKAIAQLEQLRAATNQTTKAAESSAEASSAAAETKVAALVEERGAIRANLVAYQALAASATAGSEEQVAATQLAVGAERELGITAKATATSLTAGATVAAGSMKKLVTPVLAIGAAATYLDFNFSQAMQRIRTGAGASQAEVDRMSKSVLDMAHTAAGAGQSPVKLANGLYYLESAGYRGEKALKMLSAAAVNASTTGADLTEVTKALAAARKVDIAGAETETKAMGTLNAIVGAGMMNLGDLTGALSTGILPAAKAVGITLPQVGAALDTMTIAGIPAQQAATKLTATFLRMLSPTGAAAKALKSLGINQQDLGISLQRGGLTAALALLVKHYDATAKASGKVYAEQQLMAAFGRSKGGSAILALVQGYDTYNASLAKVNKTTKDYEKNSKAAMETPAMKARIAVASLEASLTSVGSDTLPMVAKAAQMLAGAIATVTSSFRGWGKVLVGLVLLAVAARMVILSKALSGVAAMAVKAMVALFRVAAAETAVGAGGAVAGAGAAGAIGPTAALSLTVKIFAARLLIAVAAVLALNAAVKKMTGYDAIHKAITTETAGSFGGDTPVWDPKKKQWMDPNTNKPMGKAAQKHWNEVAKSDPSMKGQNPYTGRSTNPIVAKAQQLGVGSGGVYKKGGGHGGIAKPGSVLDCSGYTYQIFTQNGFKGFPGTSETQWSTDSGPNWASERIPASQAKPGDLVFSVGSGYASPGHVGIVVSGSGANAEVMQYYSTGKPADTVKLSSKSDLVGVKRFYLVKQGAKTTSGDTSYNPPPDAPSATKKQAAATLKSDTASARKMATALTKSVESIVSPTLRATLRAQVAGLNKSLEDVGSEKELTKIKGRATKIAAAIKAAVSLNSVSRQLKDDTNKLLALVGKLPADMAGPLAMQLTTLLKKTQDVSSKGLAKNLQKQLDAIQKAYEKALQKLEDTVTAKRDSFSGAWGKLADKALQVFDAKTQDLLDASDAAYDEQTKAAEAANALDTPNEAKLKVLETLGTTTDNQNNITDAQKALDDAHKLRAGWDGTQSEIEQKIQDAERALAAAQLAQQEQDVGTQADAERQAADDVLAVQEDAIQKQKDAADKAITDQRDALREALSDRLDMIQTEFQSDEPDVVAQGQKDMAALLSDPEFQGLFQDAGSLIGQYFAGGFTSALAAVTAALGELTSALGAVNVATGVATNYPWYGGPAGPGFSGGYTTTPSATVHLAGGGKVPGPTMVSRSDTVAARLTPGEYVIDRQLTAQLQDALAGGGLGGDTFNFAPNIHFHKSVLGMDKKRFAKEMVGEMQGELDRSIRSRNRRG